MNNEILSILPNMKINELWSMYDMHFRLGDIENEDEYEKVKYGDKITLDIRKYIRFLNGELTGIKKNHKSDKVWIGRRKRYKMQDFDDEIDERKAIMRSTLIEIYSEDDDKTEPRIKMAELMNTTL